MTQRAGDIGRPRLLIATRNPGKMLEYRQLLRDVPYELVSLDDLGISDEVEETGDTFQENAWLKARTYGALGGILTLADDSGLEVDALGGQPGVFSSRYGEESPLAPLYERGGQGGLYESGGQGGLYESGGQSVSPSGHMSDQDRVALLLRNLEGVPWEQRTARFRCYLVIAMVIAMPFGPSSPNEAPIGDDFVKETLSRPPFVKGVGGIWLR